MTSKDWHWIASEYRESGETQASFCRRHGVTASALQYHLKKPQQETKSQEVGSFIRIGELIEIDLPTGARVRIPASGELLKVILEACGAVTR